MKIVSVRVYTHMEVNSPHLIICKKHMETELAPPRKKDPLSPCDRQHITILSECEFYFPSVNLP